MGFDESASLQRSCPMITGFPEVLFSHYKNCFSLNQKFSRDFSTHLRSGILCSTKFYRHFSLFLDSYQVQSEDIMCANSSVRRNAASPAAWSNRMPWPCNYVFRYNSLSLIPYRVSFQKQLHVPLTILLLHFDLVEYYFPSNDWSHTGKFLNSIVFIKL